MSARKWSTVWQNRIQNYGGFLIEDKHKHLFSICHSVLGFGCLLCQQSLLFLIWIFDTWEPQVEVCWPLLSQVPRPSCEVSWGTWPAPTILCNLSLLFLIWIPDTWEPEEGACRPLPHFAPGRFFCLRRQFWEVPVVSTGVNELPRLCTPFQWTGEDLCFLALNFNNWIFVTGVGKRILLDTKSCIGNEMVEFLPLIRCEESQLHVWLLSVWLMEANGPALSDLAIQM